MGGGYGRKGNEQYHDLDRVEIYTVNADSWKTSNPLPHPILNSAVAQYKNSFFLVGGDCTGARCNEDSGEFMTDIYQYNSEDDSWIRLESELRQPREDHVALVVPQSLFPQCT